MAATYKCRRCGGNYKKSEMAPKNPDYCVTCNKIEVNLLNIRILHKEKHKIDNTILNLRKENETLEKATG